LINYFRYVAYLVAALVFFPASAGSYDDFFTALKRDDAATVQALLQRGFDPNTPNPEGLDGLYLALKDGSLRAAGALVGWPKTDVDRHTPKDETPLMMASLRGHAGIARQLVARGADVNKTGWTPLHYAATGGHVEIIQLLLDHDAYIDAESPNGTTPLMMAAMYGAPGAVKLLLDAGADPTPKNQVGLTAADFAARSGRGDMAQVLRAAAQEFQRKYRRP
jgi:uncharacterized protein